MYPCTTHNRVSAIQTYNIVLIIILSELSAILMNFIHLLENYNSSLITPARFGNKLQWVVHGTLHHLYIDTISMQCKYHPYNLKKVFDWKRTLLIYELAYIKIYYIVG